MNKSMVTKQKLLVARGNKHLSNNKKTWLPWETRKIMVASKITGSQMIKKTGEWQPKEKLNNLKSIESGGQLSQ